MCQSNENRPFRKSALPNELALLTVLPSIGETFGVGNENLWPQQKETGSNIAETGEQKIDFMRPIIGNKGP